ncbi:MAG: hypothetical protein QOH90_27 [Actinomycetota bacterium]|nr:hypothetical protein [Actinomycetota bacterium]
MVCLALGATACTPTDNPAPETSQSVAASATPSSAPSKANEEPDEVSKPEARRLHANELGRVPVLMYHRILRHPESEYDRTPRAFRQELRRLYREGYRPIRAIDLVRGDIVVPPGKSPVVLTFDDASREQFAYRGNGSVDPHTALGILLDFGRSHPSFHPVATLYVNRSPFGTSKGPSMLRDLYRRGFELGNHTASHADLATLSKEGVRKELAQGEKVITSAVPAAKVQTLALPLGIWPRRHRWAIAGSWRGLRYRHLGVFLVGAEPAASPFSRAFDPFAIPRVRTSPQKGKTPNYGSTFWLDYLRKHPEERFISDGDPATVSFPRSERAELLKRYREAANPY